MKKIPQDIVGDIAILKFPRRTLWIIKKLKARKFLKQHKNVKTIVEKTSKISGRLRTTATKHLAGIKNKVATYKENDCLFKFNIDKSYFSPRLSNERKVISEQVEKLVPKLGSSKIKNSRIIDAKHQQIGWAGKNFENKILGQKGISKILVMFAGIAPYPITIAKRLKERKKSAIIISNELNKKANTEAERNIRLNKLQDYIKVVGGDAKKLPEKLSKVKWIGGLLGKRARDQRASARNSKSAHEAPNDEKQKFDIILMPRPNLKDTFLKTALKLSKKGTTIFYHGFGIKEEVLKEIKRDTKNKIGKISIRKAGDIGPKKFRWQAVFKVK